MSSRDKEKKKAEVEWLRRQPIPWFVEPVPPPFMATMTLSTARNHLHERVRNKQTLCPLCGGPAKVWPWTLEWRMAESLANLFILTMRNKGNDITRPFFPSKKWTVDRGGKAAKNEYWGFIEPLPGGPFEARLGSEGWRITDKGIDFVRGRIRVFDRTFTYQGVVIGCHGDEVDFQQAMRTNFDADRAKMSFNEHLSDIVAKINRLS